MAKLTCPLCGSDMTRIRYSFDSKRLIRHCLDCEVDWLSPRPTEKELSGATDNDYFSYFGDREARAAKISTFRRVLGRTNTVGLGKILEVGAGRAFLTEYLRGQGVAAFGIERERSIWEKIPKQIKAFVRRGDFERSKWRQKFDLILMFDLLEHLSDPVKALAKAKSILTRGGRILIITPNQDSWKRRLLQRNWSGYYLEHNFVYTPKAMNYLAEKSGLYPVLIEKFYKQVTWNYFFRALDHRYPYFLWRVLTKLKLCVNFTIDDDSMLIVLLKK